MKKNWNNPKLKNLAVEFTNEELDCLVSEERDGIHVLGKCHHGLYPDNDPAMLCCKYRGGITGFKCTYKPQNLS